MIKIEANLAVQLAVLEMHSLKVSQDRAAYEALEALAAEYHQRFRVEADLPVSEIPGVQAARTLFRAIGIEPTRRRPSSERLLQRALKQKPLYTVNNLVDVGNLCSLDFLLPICVYDSSRISGPINLRRGEGGESYLALTNQELNLADRYLLADDEGPFGSPMTDSQRTAVSLATATTLFIIFAPATYPAEQLHVQLETSAARIQQFCGGEVTYQAIVTPEA